MIQIITNGKPEWLKPTQHGRNTQTACRIHEPRPRPSAPPLDRPCPAGHLVKDTRHTHHVDPTQSSPAHRAHAWARGRSKSSASSIFTDVELLKTLAGLEMTSGLIVKHFPSQSSRAPRRLGRTALQEPAMKRRFPPCRVLHQHPPLSSHCSIPEQKSTHAEPCAKTLR